MGVIKDVAPLQPLKRWLGMHAYLFKARKTIPVETAELFKASCQMFERPLEVLGFQVGHPKLSSKIADFNGKPMVLESRVLGHILGNPGLWNL